MGSALSLETWAIGLTLNLLISLADFGLNPQDWMIIDKTQSNHLVIANKLDPEFQLIGEIKNNKWQSLEVFSI